jgi:hypothetical protein
MFELPNPQLTRGDLQSHSEELCVQPIASTAVASMPYSCGMIYSLDTMIVKLWRVRQRLLLLRLRLDRIDEGLEL